MVSLQKAMNPTLLTLASLQEAMIDEVHIMKMQQHPAVLPLHAAFLVDDQLWMVLPFVAGGSAQDIMNRQNGGQVCT